MPAFREYFYATKTDNNASNNGALLKQNQNKKQKKQRKNKENKKWRQTAIVYAEVEAAAQLHSDKPVSRIFLSKNQTTVITAERGACWLRLVLGWAVGLKKVSVVVSNADGGVAWLSTEDVD